MCVCDGGNVISAQGVHGFVAKASNEYHAGATLIQGVCVCVYICRDTHISMWSCISINTSWKTVAGDCVNEVARIR